VRYRSVDNVGNSEAVKSALVRIDKAAAPTGITLTYNGKLRDKVGQRDRARDADGTIDGVFTVALSPGSANRSVTRLELRNTAIPGGIWNTQVDDSWTLGAAAGLDSPLLNAGDDSVNFVVSDGGNFKIFAADYEGRMFGNGVKFTLTVEFGDGTSASDSVRLPFFDFDGDGKSDIGIYRDGTWIIKPSGGGANIVESLGAASDIPVPADYDGDGKTDIAIYRTNGEWEIKRSSDRQVMKVGFGGPAFIPVPGDYDGDGKADIAVYLDGGVWSILRSSDGGNTVVAHGGVGWDAVAADYDGDGKTDIAVHFGGAWSILYSSDSRNPKVPFVLGHGGPAWSPIPADYDGDGRADVAVYHPVGAWSVVQSVNNTNVVYGHGGSTAEPVPADYDGDGKADIAVYFPDGASAGAWSIKRSSDNGITSVAHGGASQDLPLN